MATAKMQAELVATAAHPPSPSETELLQGREGLLCVKQTIIDCRRSTDRSWRQMWTRIRSGTVHFSKDRGAANTSNNNNNNNNSSNSGQTTGADDMIIDLRGCTIEVAVYYTKRKHVLRLSTFNGLCEYLMQCEDNNDMVLWLDSFQQVDDKSLETFPIGFSRLDSFSLFCWLVFRNKQQPIIATRKTALFLVTAAVNKCWSGRLTKRRIP